MSDEKPLNSGSGTPIQDLSALYLSVFNANESAGEETDLGILESYRPDWSHWLKMSVVTIKEACWLLVDIEPRLTGRSELLIQAFIEAREYYERLHVVQSALFCKELNFIPVGKNFIDGMVKLADFVKWADSLGYEMPDELRGIPDKRQSSFHDTKPAYFDENHPMFSRELFIAIEAWEQVLLSNPPKPKTKSRKQLILDWLEKHHKELPTQAKKRIATMLNPDDRGGAPKSF